jgi:hydrogenase 3 maturation protease
MTPSFDTAQDVEAGLVEVTSRHWLLLGVGNDLRGDDGFGPELARRLSARGGPALDAGTAPEMLSGPIRRVAPEVLLIADAAELGLVPGALRLMDAGEIEPGATGTHDPSLRMLLDFLAGELEFEAYALVVQPGTREFGVGRTGVVDDAIEAVVRVLTR